MEEEDIEKAVIAYLKKKGFKQTELAFQEEHQLQQQQQPQPQQSKNSSSNSQTDPDIVKLILSFTSEYFLSPLFATFFLLFLLFIFAAFIWF